MFSATTLKMTIIISKLLGEEKTLNKKTLNKKTLNKKTLNKTIKVHFMIH